MSRETGIGEAVAKAMTALDQAEKQFTSYAEHHHAKGADDKAATNYGYATLCGDALEHLKLYFEQKAKITQALADLVAMRKAP